MGKIFCLIGKSSSGKDTIFKLLKEDKELDLKPVVPYTTRPKRNNETDGIEYHFINEDMLNEYARLAKIVEKREYNTVNGKWCYCTIDDGQIDLDKGNYLLIATLEAYKILKSHFGVENVIPIYIVVEDAVRLERALVREKQQPNPNYDELCRRFLADSEDFSVPQLVANGINVEYQNNNLENCLTRIKEDLLKRLL